MKCPNGHVTLETPSFQSGLSSSDKDLKLARIVDVSVGLNLASEDRATVTRAFESWATAHTA